jgi:23S rRNA-/tRNA-specific pseudouridylate synthase
MKKIFFNSSLPRSGSTLIQNLLAQNPALNEDLLPRFGLVHRIDKNTTGLIVLAKTPEAASHLAKQFFNILS